MSRKLFEKLTYDYVKNYIEENGYVLLSTEYVNSKTKLEVKCPNGHVHNIRFNDFKSGHRCPICSKVKKLTYNYVKEQIEKRNFKLISSAYINSSSHLKLKCENNHEWSTSYNNFQSGYGCPICAKNKKLNIDDIRISFEKENYVLISTTYKNNNNKLKTICPSGHEWETSYNNFQNGNRCIICSRNNGNHVSKSEKEIVKFIKENYNGIILENDKNTIRNSLTNRMLELDVFLPELNKAIEFGSKYYHNKPDQIQRDKEKIIQCKKKNIDLLNIDYLYWLTNKENCLDTIRKFLNNVN